eukprot:Tamp_28847.p1 GENE.Tamp_28847~~Tamp_28847.p1  ORF type:complete len:171 (+),score=13.67 Tamp_28847:98-610(+)
MQAQVEQARLLNRAREVELQHGSSWTPTKQLSPSPSLVTRVDVGEINAPILRAQRRRTECASDVFRETGAGRSSAGGAHVALLRPNRDAENKIGVSFKRDSNGVHVASALLPGLRCTSGQILPGDKLLLVNGAAVTGLQTEVVEQMIQAVADQGTAVALTVVSQPCTGQG